MLCNVPCTKKAACHPPHYILNVRFLHPHGKVYIVELTELELLRKFLLFLVFLFLQTLVQCSVVNCSLRALCNRYA